MTRTVENDACFEPKPFSVLDAQNRAVGELLLQRKGTVWFGEEFFGFWNLVVELGPGRFVFVGH